MLGVTGVEKVSLLPYHNLGILYFALCEIILSDLKEPSEEIMKDIANLL